ncbi:hypothetical protein BC936DRAFT_142911 [Jimgerdemannia flammicorona]|uniref:SH3 domain-containing protein n=1 Tax=Jimgerdemannia flammicorona TaxID=994334 RepID=A0A433DEP4_9FUNG|nr:hypothetical protein BC936DRAFT_142911 [Jimgerdemannia flammicorona]
MGFGGQIGAELTDFVVILNNKEAVKTFSHGGSVTLGGNLSGELPSLRLIGEVMSVFVTGAVKDRKLGLTCGHIISSNVSPVPTCPLTTLCFPHAVAAGPVGRNAEAGGSATFKHVAAIYSYRWVCGLRGWGLSYSEGLIKRFCYGVLSGRLIHFKTKGLFAGVSIEGSVIVERNDANAKFYGQEVTAKDLLNGSVPQPPQADMLYRALNAKLGRLGSTANMYTPGEDQPDGQGGGKPFPPPSYPASQRASYQQPPVQIPVEAEPLKRNIVHGRPVPPPPPMKPRKDPTATALYDFTGEQDGDLTFRKGDIIVVTKKSESTNDWWTGRANGREGSVRILEGDVFEMLIDTISHSSQPQFPANYVQLNN